jgi:hypothetical protein
MMTRAGGFTLYSARSFAASPNITAAFHCSSGANVAGALPFAAAACPLAASALPRSAHAITAEINLRCITFILSQAQSCLVLSHFATIRNRCGFSSH